MKEIFQIHNGRLYVKALITGCITGLIVTAYRFLLHYANVLTGIVADTIQKQKWYILALFAILIAASFLIAVLIKKYPLIKGSGIPQVKGVLEGVFHFSWLRELIAKFIGGIVSLACGLSLGREGPSIQLGAYIATGVGEIGNTGEEEKKYILMAGSASGLASAFNAPLAGIVFAFEELKSCFSHVLLVCVMISCISAQVVTELLAGQATVFTFAVEDTLSVMQYPLLLPLAGICGLLAAFFNKSLFFSLDIHDKIKNPLLRPLPAFCTAGILFIVFPLLLGNGQTLLEAAQDGHFAIISLCILIFAKLVYTALSYGSGSPGGIFFPLLILGALIGKLYGDVLISVIPSVSPSASLCIVLGMTAFFSGVTRAPITGCILISEMTGSLSHFIPLVIVSLVSYGIAKYAGAEPIYEALLDRMKERRHE